jgi:hypothetical protein
VTGLSLTVEDRIRKRKAEASAASRLFEFVQEGSLATFWRQATPGTTYWRGYLPMKYLPGQVLGMKDDSISGYETPDDPLVLHGQEGAAIWQFLGDEGRTRIALQMQRQGVRTILEVDDNYLRYAPTLYGKSSAWTKTIKEAEENGTGYSVEMHRELVPRMDSVIVSTDNLANAYEALNPNIYVCPNSVDPADWNVERVPSENLRIGYYGSPSHARDYPLVKKALKWALKQPGVEVNMIGFVPPAWGGKTLPWQDDLYEGRKALGVVDVGIAPLTVNHWSVGKSDIKALEYAMAGAMPILQDSEPFRPWKDAGWEWMAKTEQDWVDVIHDVVAMRDEVPMLARDAKQYVLSERTIQDNVHHWKEAVA